MFNKEINSIEDYTGLTNEEKLDYLTIIETRRILRNEYEKPENLNFARSEISMFL